MHYSDVEEKIMRGSRAALEKKALDLVVFDLREISDVADYFMICHGMSDKQVRAIADAIEKALREAGATMDHKEGYQEATWILLDYGDIVIHVFTEEKRQYYDLERLWGDAPRIDVAYLITSPADEQTRSH
jgi:ribosome-associated protein